MGQELELATNRLFGADSLQAKNIKFYPGTNRDTTPEQVSQQINNAISQILNGDFEEYTEKE